MLKAMKTPNTYAVLFGTTHLYLQSAVMSQTQSKAVVICFLFLILHAVICKRQSELNRLHNSKKKTIIIGSRSSLRK